MNQRKTIILLGMLFSLVFALFYHVLFTFVLQETEQETRVLFVNQVGLYEQDKSIQSMQKKLEANGIASYTMKQQDVTAVICGVSTREEENAEVQEKLKELKYSYITKKITVENSEIITYIDEKDYEQALERIGNES